VRRRRAELVFHLPNFPFSPVSLSNVCSGLAAAVGSIFWRHHFRLPKNVSSPSVGDPQMCSPIEMLPLQNFTEMLAVLPFNFAQATCGPSAF